MTNQKTNSELITRTKELLLKERLEANQKVGPQGYFDNKYIEASTSDNTRRAYRADIRHFEQWGGLLPAKAEHVVKYLHQFAGELSSRTLVRRLTAIKNWHVYQEFNDPTQHIMVKKTMSGIMRMHGKPRVKVPPLLPEHLILIAKQLEQIKDLKALRDNALLQTGFFGAFRRSELINIQYEDIKWVEDGIEVHIKRSKTDQHGEGQFCVIPYCLQGICAVNALKVWINAAKITSGPIFLRVLKNNRVGNKGISSVSVNQIIKKRALQAEIKSAHEFSSHSMRRGLATSASRDGAGIASIMRQGRWKQVNTVMEYVEAAERFSDNVVNSLKIFSK